MADAKGKPLISFGFMKTTKGSKKLENSNFEKTEETVREKDFVLSLEGKQIKSSVPVVEPKELVIPLKLRSTWNAPALKQESLLNIDKNDRSLEAEAAREIIKEVSSANSEDKESKSDLVIPSFIENRIPDGYETKDKLDVSIRADESTLEDYDKVPITEFGLALMRGMGWKMGDPIGKTNKGICKPVEAVLRPKSLGLGADRAQAEKLLAQFEDTEEGKAVTKGSFIQVNSGTHGGKYGQVEGFDDEGVRVLVRLAVGGKIVTVSQYIVRRVSKKEFQEKGKTINSVKYEEYKSKQEKDKRPEKREHEDFAVDLSKLNNSKHRRTSPNSERDHHPSSKKKAHVSDESDGCSSGEDRPWVQPQIRVRFINKRHKQGSYFNTKMVVIDVANLEMGTCICQAENGRLLEDIPFDWLETVIPRHSPYVKIVKGHHYGKIGTILEKDKNHCTALVQLTHDKDIILKLHYDSICEYVGSVDDINAL